MQRIKFYLIVLEQYISNRKKLFIGIGALIVILVVVLIVSLSLNKSSKVQNNTVSQVTPTAAPVMNYTNWSRIHLDTFSLEVPLGSNNILNTFDGGYMVTVQPPTSPDFPNEPIFDVEAYNTPQNLAQKQILYRDEGAKKAILTVNDMQLPELQGSYKMRMINSSPIYTPTQLRLAYLVLPHSFYVFRMYYSSSMPVPTDENLYKQFIASFTLNK